MFYMTPENTKMTKLSKADAWRNSTDLKTRAKLDQKKKKIYICVYS